MEDITRIALTLAGIATIALLVSNAQGVTQIIDSGARAYGGLLGVVTLQSNYSNLFSN